MTYFTLILLILLFFYILRQRSKNRVFEDVTYEEISELKQRVTMADEHYSIVVRDLEKRIEALEPTKKELAS